VFDRPYKQLAFTHTFFMSNDDPRTWAEREPASRLHASWD